MTDPLRELIARTLLAHHVTRERDGLVVCFCGERFENHSGPDGHALHQADAVAVALSDAARCLNCGKTMAEHDAMAHCWCVWVGEGR